MQEQKIKCPSCDMEISIDEVMTRQIETKIKKGFEEQQKIKEAEIVKKESDILEREKEMKSREQNFFEKLEHEKLKIRDEVKKQAGEERIKIEEDAFRRANEKNEIVTVLLRRQLEESENNKKNERKIFEEQIKEKEKRLNESQTKEIEIRKEKNKLEEDKKNFELEKQRQLDEERQKITEEASHKAAEKEQYRIAQLEKQLSDATKVNNDLTRKLEQGSQQTQGEVLELKLEELLKQEFFSDEIMPVPKGINGADIIQRVISRTGKICGQIIWEVKKTKAWSEGWVQKLKDDQRIIKAELAVIVSAVLPDNIKGFIFRDGIWICDIKMAIALASALRINLEAIAREKAMAVGKNEKVEFLYAYLTGVEFKQRVEAMMEAFMGMQDGLNKEKRAYQKIWAEREKQIQKAGANIIGMYGDLSGLVALPQIKTLELENGAEEGNGII